MQSKYLTPIHRALLEDAMKAAAVRYRGSAEAFKQSASEMSRAYEAQAVETEALAAMMADAGRIDMWFYTDEEKAERAKAEERGRG